MRLYNSRISTKVGVSSSFRYFDMASHVHTEPPLLPVNGIHYRAPSGYIQTSPHKFEKLSNHDTRKHATGLKPNVAIDRPLLGVSSMGHTILVDLNTFEKEVLGVKAGLEAIAALPRKLVDDVCTTLKWLFKFGASPAEDAIATKFVSHPWSSDVNARR